MVGDKSREDAPFRVYSNMSGDYCEVGRRVSVGREEGRRIEVEDCEVRVCEEDNDEGTSFLHLGT